MATFFGFALSDFGRITESTPFVYSAATSFSLTSHGSVTVREKLPEVLSIRWKVFPFSSFSSMRLETMHCSERAKCRLSSGFAAIRRTSRELNPLRHLTDDTIRR